MRIRLRGPSGASTLTFGEDATVGDLWSLITEKTSLTRFEIKHGYPPRPLILDNESAPLSSLEVRLDGEQLTISAYDGPSTYDRPNTYDRPSTKGGGMEKGALSGKTANKTMTFTSHQDSTETHSSGPFLFAGMSGPKPPKDPMPSKPTAKSSDPIALKRKFKKMEVPELPLPDRGATMVLRVMPDDNSCLFRAFGTAVLPGDDLSITELRSLVAVEIQAQPDIYTKVVLEQNPDDYCRWIQKEDAWGGAIELTILSQHFDIEVCSIDVQSLRIDRFNEGRPTRCILVYSGIHYDTIVQSPSEPPYTKADNPPELDRRVWDADDDEIMLKAQKLCKHLQAQHYYTDTGGMAIKCIICGWVGYGEGQAQGHAQQTGHYDMTELKA